MAVKQLLGGRYQFIKTLGSDVDGGTYLVGDTYLEGHPKCVIKRLPLDGKGPRALQFILLLLQKKAEALKHMGTHEQVPKILAYFEEKHNFYLVEEFIPGRPLSNVLKPKQPLSEDVVVQLLEEVLKILMVVHSWGVIHRCIKPSNIIQRQTDGKLVLTGFGIFREISAQSEPFDDEDARTSIEPEQVYTSPDQLQGDRHFNSDIYSVGMIGIQALSGLTTAQLAKLRNGRRRNGTAASMQLLWHKDVSASPMLMTVLDRMVHLHSEQRYQTAAEVLEDVRKLHKDHKKQTKAKILPVDAPAPSPLLSVAEPSYSQTNRRTSSRPLMWGIGLACLIGLGAWLYFGRIPQQTRAYLYMRQGKSALKNNQYQQAITDFSNALNQEESGYAFLQRGLAYQKLDQWREAQSDFSQAIQLDPSLDQAYFQRGNIRFSLGDGQGALEDYSKAIALNPKAIKAYVNRGTVRGDLGDEQGAIDDYTIAIQGNPSLASAYLNRCLSRSNLDDHGGAITDCSQAIALEPNSVMAYQNRGLVRRRLGDSAGALKDLNIAINLDPDDPDPYYNRGLARLELGDSLGAIEDYTETIKRAPHHALAYYDRGLVKLDIGDKLGAFADFQTSAKLCLDAGRQGCYEDARYQLEQLQQREPQLFPSDGSDTSFEAKKGFKTYGADFASD
ncbi:MAG: protein kinase family protein [Cyanobacteria bacterium P01_F01_bin.150]